MSGGHARRGTAVVTVAVVVCVFLGGREEVCGFDCAYGRNGCVCVCVCVR